MSSAQQPPTSTSKVKGTPARTALRQGARYAPYPSASSKPLRSPAPAPPAGAAAGASPLSTKPSSETKTRINPSTVASTSSSNASGGSMSDYIEKAQYLVEKTWHVFRVSPLFSFSTSSPAALRQYARDLTAVLHAARSQSHVSVMEASQLNPPSDADDIGSALVAPFPALHESLGIAEERGSESNNTALAFVVTAPSRKAPTGGTQLPKPSAPLLVAVLGSFHPKDQSSSPQGAAALGNQFTALPLLLLKGSPRLSKEFTAWLETRFDCRVSHLAFPPAELAWMAFMWSARTYNNALISSVKTLELTYDVPATVFGLRQITYSLHQESVKQLCDALIAEQRARQDDTQTHKGTQAWAADSPAIDSANFGVFAQALEEHFYHCFRIHLSALQLTRVGSPVAYVGAEGRLKLFSRDGPMIHSVLCHLTSLARISG